MAWFIALGIILVNLGMILLSVWLWSSLYRDLHPIGKCDRIYCGVGNPRYYSYDSRDEALDDCVLVKSKIWGFIWPIGLVYIGLLVMSHGGLNSWRVKDRQRKADLRELEIRENEVRKIQAELRSGYPVGSVEWEKKFKELEQEDR